MMGSEQVWNMVSSPGYGRNPNAGSDTEPKLRRTLRRPVLDAFAAFVVFGLAHTAVTCSPSSASPSLASPSSANMSPAAFADPYETPASAAMNALGEAGDRPIIEIATTSSSANADAVYKRTSAQAAWGLLALAFSLLAALNLAMLRHLRHAYAVPRKRNSETK